MSLSLFLPRSGRAALAAQQFVKKNLDEVHRLFFLTDIVRYFKSISRSNQGDWIREKLAAACLEKFLGLNQPIPLSSLDGMELIGVCWKSRHLLGVVVSFLFLTVEMTQRQPLYQTRPLQRFCLASQSSPPQRYLRWSAVKADAQETSHRDGTLGVS